MDFDNRYLLVDLFSYTSYLLHKYFQLYGSLQDTALDISLIYDIYFDNVKYIGNLALDVRAFVYDCLITIIIEGYDYDFHSINVGVS